MAQEFKLSFTASEINQKLGKIDSLASKSEVPTKTSDLTNDSGFITGYTETDPTVPAWAKAATKPTYTAEEVGAIPAAELPNAVNEALAQAKASGEFDGKDGKTPAKGTDYFTDADIAEIVDAVYAKVADGNGVAY